MIELYNALKCITMLFFIQKILMFNLGVAFLKSMSIYMSPVRKKPVFGVSHIVRHKQCQTGAAQLWKLAGSKNF